MKTKLVPALISGLLLFNSCNTTKDPAPERFQLYDPGLTLELVASDPQIRTPIGMAIDDRDDIYVLESHTHSPPEDYQGPDYDRILKGIDHDRDGLPEDWLIYADSLEDGMNLVFGPNQQLFATTKNEVWVFIDQDGDGISDQRRLLLDMVEPESPYDHAAILGVAVSPDNQWLFVSRGNTGASLWEIVGTDGAKVSGYGDGGNVIRCRLDGSQVEEVATGFWNPFDIKFTTDGRLMLTDNDPDSRGPNRLIEIVPGGDYGYKSLYGGSGLHPFVAWNAELPGTLPYAAPLGEAPCALLDGNMTGFGEDYQNAILVSVWEEKNIVKIPMTAYGSTVRGVPEVLIQGDSTFHPVALVTNSKGDVYLTNWVVRQYPNHGKGEIWRISKKDGPNVQQHQSLDHYRFKQEARSKDQILKDLVSDDPFLQTISRWELLRTGTFQEISSLLEHENPEMRLQGLMVLSRYGDKLSGNQLGGLLDDKDLRVRQMALYYIGTRQVQGVDAILQASLRKGNITPELFELYLATVQNLSPGFVQGYQQKIEPKASSLKRELPENFILNIIKDPEIAEPIRALALPYLDQAAEYVDFLAGLLASTGNNALQLSLINTLRNIFYVSNNQIVNSSLFEVILNVRNSSAVRANAVTALQAVTSEQCLELKQLLTDADSVIQYAIVKQLCSCADELLKTDLATWIADNGVTLSPAVTSAWEHCQSPPTSVKPKEYWVQAVNDHGSAIRGELVFKSAFSMCQTCHTVGGWGGQYGPDLTRIGSSKSRALLINAILDPSAEMAPEWQGWYVIDQDGNRHVGRQIDVHMNNVELMNIDGTFDNYREPQSFGVSEKSVMPEGLQNSMTQFEFNDLITYLESLK